MGLLAQNPSQGPSSLAEASQELPVTGLPLENLADLGSPASNLP
jgi:hypothetical protein